MLKFTGKGVYGEIAFGTITLLSNREADVMSTHITHITDIQAEKERLEQAKALSIGQLNEMYEKMLKEVGEEAAQIFEIHIMMLEDEDYNDSVLGIIESQSVNAEYAVSETSDRFAKLFASMDDSYMQARVSDVRDISNRLISNLLGEEGSERPRKRHIICAEDLTPSETASFDRDSVFALVTAKGSTNSHTAILARSRRIPAVIGVGDEFLAQIKDGDGIIVDGSTGEVYVNPDEHTLLAMLKKRQAEVDRAAMLEKLRLMENVTLDGRRIDIFANIGGVGDIDGAIECNAGGIGLFRSEFLYLESKDFPTEEQQLAVYKKVLESMAGKKVIIRTLDIGADKQVGYFNLPHEENPALGCRAIRLCLKRPDIFKTQLRALYRASVFGNLGIMFPMITSVKELERIYAVCGEVKAELREQGIAYSDKIEIGIMIETPAAAIISDRLAPMVDFFSVGTNDLTQYTLACDRQNPNIEEFCDPRHEAILRLIEMTAQNAHTHGAWIGICGELAADTALTKRFLKMGIDELSVSPAFILKVREAVRSTDLTK